LTRRFGEVAEDVRRRVLLPLPPAAGDERFLFPRLSGVGKCTTRSIFLKRSLQHGHLFSVFAHLSIQSKQKRCVHPEIVANSVRDEGASKQIAHVKSFGTVVSLLFAEAEEAAAATATIEDLAAGFNSLRGTSSSSESLLHKSMGDSGALLRVLCDAALRRAELLLLLVGRLTVVEEEGDDNIALLLSKSLFVLLLLRVDDDADAAVAKRVERR